jgi:hypothetical protein
MDFRNFWLDITPKILYQYDIVCPQCKNKVTIIQKKGCISHHIKYVFEKSHIYNNYSSYYENINNDFGNSIVDVEIWNNKPCIVNKLFDSNTVENITNNIINKSIFAKI